MAREGEQWLPTFYARRGHIKVDYVATGEANSDKAANRLRSDVVNLPPARKSQWEHRAQSLPGKNLKSGVPTDSVRPDPGSYFHPDVPRVLGPIWAALFDRNELSVADALKQAREATAGVVGADESR